MPPLVVAVEHQADKRPGSIVMTAVERVAS